MRKLIVYLIIMPFLLVFGCTKDEAPTEPQRLKTPDFILQDTDDNTFQLSSTQGDVVLLHFFLTWCGTCVDEAGSLNALHKEYKEDGVTIIGIALDSGNLEVVKAFIDNLELEYPLLLDDGVVSAAYGILEVVPQIFVIDRDGWIVYSETGGHTKEDIQTLIDYYK